MSFVFVVAAKIGNDFFYLLVIFTSFNACEVLKRHNCIIKIILNLKNSDIYICLYNLNF
jgi:hypothetical protein